jgi:hypothetical protein
MNEYKFYIVIVGSLLTLEGILIAFQWFLILTTK